MLVVSYQLSYMLVTCLLSVVMLIREFIFCFRNTFLEKDFFFQYFYLSKLFRPYFCFYLSKMFRPYFCFYLSKIFRPYFYFYLSINWGVTFYFYLSTKYQYFAEVSFIPPQLFNLSYPVTSQTNQFYINKVSWVKCMITLKSHSMILFFSKHNPISKKGIKCMKWNIIYNSNGKRWLQEHTSGATLNISEQLEGYRTCM